MDTLKYVVYDKAGTFRRQFSGVRAEVEPMSNQTSTATLTLDDDHAALPALTARGARCSIEFRGHELFRGKVTRTPGTGPKGAVQIFIESDIRKLWHWYGWPVPGAAITAQTSEYRNYSGRAESVFKTALSENIARLGIPWTVAPTLGRGALIPTGSPVSFRFHPLAEKLIPVLDNSDLVVVLTYDSLGRPTVDIREADTVQGVITLGSGVVDGYKFSVEAPTATRAIVGGRGEGVERELVTVVDSAREAEWGDIIETFVDSRNSDVGTNIAPYGTEALVEAAPRVGVALDIVETKKFQYLKQFREGDLAHVRLGPIDSLEQITSVSISEDPDDGVLVTPHIGSADVDAEIDVALARAIGALARGQRDQGRR